MYLDSHWAHEFIASGTVLILPLGVYNQAVTGRMGIILPLGTCIEI